jgi:hypothetical protein
MYYNLLNLQEQKNVGYAHAALYTILREDVDVKRVSLIARLLSCQEATTHQRYLL